MPTCSRCGTKYGFMSEGRGLCKACQPIVQREIAEKRFAEAGSVLNADAPQHILDSQAAGIRLSTTSDIPGAEIVDLVGIVGGEAALAMNVPQDFVNNIVDLVGGRSHTVQATLRAARETSLIELKREAVIAGADAVVGIKFEYSQIATNSGGILVVAAVGTAVKVA